MGRLDGILKDQADQPAGDESQGGGAYSPPEQADKAGLTQDREAEMITPQARFGRCDYSRLTSAGACL
jgi:hypothetical protein